MLQTSRGHSKLSAYHVLKGPHDFNRVPFAPPGTRATIFAPPEICTLVGPKAIDCWYVGLAYNHYRCWQFQLPSTGGMRTLGQATFYPQHWQVSRQTSMDETKLMASQLLNVIQKLRGEQEFEHGRHDEALERLARFFQTNTGKVKKENTTIEPSSTNLTVPATLRAAPRVHLKRTRNNNPEHVPSIQIPTA